MDAPEVSEDDDSDSFGYFLQPASTGISIAEKVLDANKILFDDPEGLVNLGERIQRVRFSEEFETFHAAIPSEASSDRSEINEELSKPIESKEKEKLLLVLVPNLENSSSGESDSETVADVSEPKKYSAPKERPKSANRGAKEKKLTDVKMAKVTPDFNPSNGIKKILSKNKEASAKSRGCCPRKDNLPRYNGLNSEYGLSAEQLEERKKKTAELRQKRKEDKIQRQLKQLQRKQLNEEKFWEWLHEKIKFKDSPKKPKKDTLVRSDSYIQNHAVYATPSVVYAVDYSIRKPEIHKKTVNLAKLFENISPETEKTFKIYLGD